MKRAARCGLVVVVFVASVGLVPLPAVAFDVSPPSGSVQAGNNIDAVALSSLPLTSDGSPTCLQTSGGTSVYLTARFNPPCGSSQGWSSTMSIQTIPATAAGTYQIVIDVCPTGGCATGDVRTTPPVASKSWTLQVTAAPVPVTIVSETPPPASNPPPSATQPSSGQTPAPSARSSTNPSRSAASTPAATATPSGSPPAASPSPTATVVPGPLSLGAVQLVLDRPSVPPGGKVLASGLGCNPAAPVTVVIANAVTGTTTADADGAFRIGLRLPSSLRAGRYQVVARCGPTVGTLLDVQAAHRRALQTAAIVLALVVALGLGVAVGGLARSRRLRGDRLNDRNFREPGNSG